MIDLELYDSLLPFRESINVFRHLGYRPLCPCCGGGSRRKGYTLTKASSRAHTCKAIRPMRQCNFRDTIRKENTES